VEQWVSSEALVFKLSEQHEPLCLDLIIGGNGRRKFLVIECPILQILGLDHFCMGLICVKPKHGSVLLPPLFYSAVSTPPGLV